MVTLCVVSATACSDPATSGLRDLDVVKSETPTKNSTSLFDEKSLADIGHRHNEGMRYLAGQILERKGAQWTRATICDVSKHAAISVSTPSDERALEILRAGQSLVDSKLPRLAARLRDIRARSVNCDWRRTTVSTSPPSIFYTVVRLHDPEPPLIPFTNALSDVLNAILSVADDEPLPSIVSGRLSSIRNSAGALDSIESGIALAVAEVADSSYSYWHGELPAQRIASEPYLPTDTSVSFTSRPCTESGLPDGAGRDVLQSDVEGAIGGAIAAALLPATWVGGFFSAAPVIAGASAILGVTSSAAKAGGIIFFQRERRC